MMEAAVQHRWLPLQPREQTLRAFSAVTTGPCAATAFGASYTSTLSFTPPAVVTSTATLTAQDTAGKQRCSGRSGTVAGTVRHRPSHFPPAPTPAHDELAITDATWARRGARRRWLNAGSRRRKPPRSTWTGLVETRKPSTPMPPLPASWRQPAWSQRAGLCHRRRRHPPPARPSRCLRAHAPRRDACPSSRPELPG